MDVFFFYQYYCIQNACQKREQKLNLLILNKCVSSADTFTKYVKVEEHIIPLYIILAYNKHMQMDVFFFYQYYCMQNACQKREVSIQQMVLKIQCM